jgi:hypothetical protein
MLYIISGESKNSNDLRISQMLAKLLLFVFLLLAVSVWSGPTFAKVTVLTENCSYVMGCQRRSKNTPLAGVKVHHWPERKYTIMAASN